ncbi:UNVERIFIED_CONTAM: hypothetical protein GTU68_048325 [Idotea baltica]|nr:hypothetical protein [Idotea baltica]
MANPAPPIGPTLGQYGINIMDFCKQFNQKTSLGPKGIPVPTRITIYKDKTFNFIIKKPTVTYLLKNSIKLKKGSSFPATKKVGVIQLSQLKVLVQKKKTDFFSLEEKSMINTIVGSARSMGITVDMYN